NMVEWKDASFFGNPRHNRHAPQRSAVQDRRQDRQRQETRRLFQPLLGRQSRKAWLEIDRWKTEFLYISSLPAGLGCNDIGLDRGQLGGTHIVRFERIGPKVLLIESNYHFRANSDNPDERRAVRDSFAESTLWGFHVETEDASRVLVDATAFYL